MKNKNKKNNWICTVLVSNLLVVMATLFFCVVPVNADNSAVACICKATADSMTRTATIYVATPADCDQNCANKYGSGAYYALGLEGSYQPVTKASGGTVNTVHTCVCSVSGTYVAGAITGTTAVSDESSCIAQCQSSKGGVYNYDEHGYKDVPSPALNTAPKAIGTQKFSYTLLESFPGFFNAGTVAPDLPTFILAVYKFGIWTVGIAGLFMMVVGGFMYMASAGNTSTASSARNIIWDSLFGIVAALGAYLILYVINPDLTKINISFTSVNVEATEGTPMGPSGVCKPATNAACSVEALTPAFGAKATEASSICNGESNGGQPIPSGVDKCADGTPASWGLFQINITAHPIGGYPCPDAFTGGMYTSKNHNCKLKTDAASQALYQNCVTAAKNSASNIAAAKDIYTRAGNSWKQWGANKSSGCNFN